jgi:hypothetical protein
VVVEVVCRRMDCWTFVALRHERWFALRV